MNTNIDWLNVTTASPSFIDKQAAEQRQAELTKPLGALGRLEQVIIELAALQHTPRPCIDKVYISVFAADHGVAQENVSAFPQAVTAQMVKNFSRGGAAINILAKSLQASLEVINLGTLVELGSLANVIHSPLGPGTKNFCLQAAMDTDQLQDAMQAGWEAAERAQHAGAQLFIGGEMGIGNTTSATALACALLETAPALLVGPGTGLNKAGIARKSKVIHMALHRHPQRDDVLELLRCLGGFEIAALVASYLTCAHLAIPVLIDGFISSVAALVAARIRPDVQPWLLYSHRSAEPGHTLVLRALQAQPLVDLGMRLGEGSGAATVVPLLRLACALHNQMATFSQAQVSASN